MKLSEMIARLQELLEANGDLKVLHYYDEYGDMNSTDATMFNVVTNAHYIDDSSKTLSPGEKFIQMLGDPETDYYLYHLESETDKPHA